MIDSPIVEHSQPDLSTFFLDCSNADIKFTGISTSIYAADNDQAPPYLPNAATLTYCFI